MKNRRRQERFKNEVVKLGIEWKRVSVRELLIINFSMWTTYAHTIFKFSFSDMPLGRIFQFSHLKNKEMRAQKWVCMCAVGREGNFFIIITLRAAWNCFFHRMGCAHEKGTVQLRKWIKKWWNEREKLWFWTYTSDNKSVSRDGGE